MGEVKWKGVQGGLDFQCQEALRELRRWMSEQDCLWLQLRPRNEITVGPADGALRRLAGDLGVPMDDFELDSEGEEWDEAPPRGAVLESDEADLTRWGHGRRRGGRKVMRKVDFSAAVDLFGAAARRSVGGGLRGAGTGGPVPAPGIEWVGQVEPALPVTPRRASPVGGEGRVAGAAAEDVAMGGTTAGGVAPAPVGASSGCGCDFADALAGVRREMAREVKKMREEVMDALGLLLAERGLGTWEEGRRLENTRGRLQREQVEAQRAHDVAVVAGKVSAVEARRAAKERQAAEEAEAAAVRQEAATVPRRERELTVRKNLDVAAESVRTAGSEKEKMGACEALSKAHGEVKKLESAATVSPEVVTTGVWQVAGGVVTRKVEVVTRLNGPVGRTRMAELRGVVERVQALVKQKGHQSWVVAAVMWTVHAADKVLWRVTGVEKGTTDSVFEDDLVGDVSAVIGTGIMRDH